MSQKVLIVGAGAIGQWLAALLSGRAGESVTLLARPRQLPSLQEGIFCWGHCFELPALSEVPSDSEWDDVLFTVKAFQVEEAAQQLAERGVRPRRVWGFQNGVGSDAKLSAIFPDRWYGSLTTTVPVAVEGSDIRPGSKGGMAWASPHDPGQQPRWLQNLGLPCWHISRVDSLKCSKLLLNLTCNASCALLDWLPRQIVAHPTWFRFELACLRELLKVMKASSIPPADLPEYGVTGLARLGRLPDWVVRPILGGKISKARGEKPPSLLLDMRAGRPQSEVEVLNGGVVELGKACGVDTPANAWLLDQLRQVVGQPERWAAVREQRDQLALQAQAVLARRDVG